MTTSGSGGDNENEWCLIESDPGVFTELLEKLGCTGVEVEELYSLEDDDTMQNSSEEPTYGLIFLFEWHGETQRAHAASQQPLTEDEIRAASNSNTANGSLFFAHQVTTNACATQALLSVLFNAVAHGALPSSNLGATLQEFAAFTAEFPPQLKGVAISGSAEILAAHNSFAPPHSFLQEGKQYDTSTRKGEAFHFVAYVPVGDTVYELDGLQSGPMVVGKKRAAAPAEEAEGASSSSSSNNTSWWLPLARTAIQERMQQAIGDSVKFNLLRVTRDKRLTLQEQQAANAAGGSNNTETEDHLLQEQLLEQEHKRAQWRLENERRRHNYVPLVVQVLRELAAAHQLRPLMEAAQEKQRRQRAEAVLNKKSNE